MKEDEERHAMSWYHKGLGIRKREPELIVHHGFLEQASGHIRLGNFDFGDLKEVVFREEERKDAIDVAKNMFANATGDRHQPLSLMILNRASAHMDSVQITFIDLEKSSMWRREEEEERGLDIYTGPTTPSGYLAHYELVAQSQCRTWIWSGNTGIWLGWSRCLESREAGSSFVKLCIFRNTRNQTSALTLML
jgi:hypothetical protein